MICLGFQKVSNCHGCVDLENPPTHKRRGDVSRSNFAMDATPKFNANFFFAAPVLSLIPPVCPSPNIKKLFFLIISMR